MLLYEIEFVNFIFKNLTELKDSYQDLANTAENSVDLNKPEHSKALLTWLYRWRNRQFPPDFHDELSDSLKKWYKENKGYLPENNKNIWELDDSNYSQIVFPYNSLSRIVTPKKIRDGKYVKTSIGPIGTSKILYALRPKSMIPLDTSTRLNFNFDGSAHSYIKYLKLIKKIAIGLDKQCRLNGFCIQELPRKINRKNATIPALIDEYHWVTITKRCKIPDKNTLKRWFAWKEP